MNKLKRSFKLIYVPIIIMMLVGMLMIGITDYITAGFDPAIFLSASFWTNMICTRVGIVCLIVSILLIRIDSFKENNEEYLKSNNNIVTFYRTKYVAPVFKKFCFEDNLKTKIIVYKENVNKEFTKVKPTADDLNIYYGDNEELKQSNEYCKKMKYYDTVLSDEYVNRVVPKLNIKYPAITESIIFTGTTTKHSSQVDFITTNKVNKILFDLLPRYLLSISGITLVSAITIDIRDGITWAIIFKTALRLFTILSQVYFAYNYADKYNSEVTMHDIVFRETKLNEYTLWETKQLKKVEQKEVN